MNHHYLPLLNINRYAMGSVRSPAISIIGAILLLVSAEAASVSTPGAIRQIDIPQGMQFQYDAAGDRSMATLPGQAQIAVSVVPAFEPRAVLGEILEAYGAAHLAATISSTMIAGQPAAAVSARLQTDNWWLVIAGDDLNLLVQVEDVNDASANRDRVEQMVRSAVLAPATYPANVAGNYSTGNHYSGDVQSSIGVYSESGITLGNDGSIVTSGHVGITGADVSGYSAGSQQDGWWQVRGDRILAFYPPATFLNYRFQAFSNGLEIYPPQGETLLWPRQ